MPQDDILRLLIADQSLNDAETLISVLRNTGYAVRATRVEDEEDLSEAVLAGQFDLMLCATELEGLPLERAQAILRQTGRDVPVLALAADDDTELRRSAMQSGAADLVDKADLAHLQLVINRELAHLNDRRRLRRLEAALREAEKRCYALLDSSRDAIAYVHEGMHIYANQAYLERFGFATMEDIEGLPLLDMAASDDQGRPKDFLRTYQKGGSDQDHLELRMVGESGAAFTVSMTFSQASIDGEPCTQILMRDTSDARALEAQLDNLSKQDGLTGLYNRPHFMEQLQRAVAVAAGGGDGSQLLLIQLDNLESVRQSLGISGVDLAVSASAAIIRAEIGDDGVVARFSDEVFTVLMTGASVHDAIAVAEAIRSRIEEHIAESDGRTVTATCSIGIASLSETSDSQTAVDSALKACEEARAKGGNQAILYTPPDSVEHGSSEELRQRLEEALEENAFFLVYQPVVSLRGESTEHYEVRVRLRTDDGTVMAPAEFIPQAEQLGLMPAIDRWILNRALIGLAERVRHNKNTVLFIKLSGPTLADGEFVGYLSERLDALELDGQRVVFQVNEPVAVTQLTQAKELFRGIKKLRCRFSLDHFGSGLNPFQLVKHLPADFLKIDGTLTRDLSDNDESRETVKQLVANAHESNRKVIGGYLGDASSLVALWQMDADYAQGYFLSEPSPTMDYDFTGMVI